MDEWYSGEFKFRSIATEHHKLIVSTTFFENAGIVPILWGYKGLYKLIPVERVVNMAETLKDSETLSPIAKNKQVGTFFWEDGVTVDPKVARILLSNQQ